MQTPLLSPKRISFHRFNLTFSIFFSSSSSYPLSKLQFILQNSGLLLHQFQHLHDLRILHCNFITSGLIHDTFAASRFIQFLLRSSTADLHYASAIFNSLRHPDVFTWNNVIAAHIELGSLDSAVTLYFSMRSSGSMPNLYTFALLVKACRKYRDADSVKQGMKVHGQVMKNGAMDFLVVKNSFLSMYCDMRMLNDARLLFDESCDLDLISWNAIVSGYGKSGDVKTARYLFDEMPERNLVSWSAMIDGYVRSGDCVEALRLFNRLQCEGIRPDVITLVTILKACGCSGAIRQGWWIHLYIERNKLGGNGNNIILCTALVDMYCRCGCIDAAFDVFNRVLNKDIVLWNAMIGGLAMHGHGHQALELFGRMMEAGMVPSESTYIGVMCACTHAGMVDEGIEIFESMKAHGVEPQKEHYGCLADLMGRAGRICKAEEVLLNMPMEPQAEQWGALMSACRMHNEFDIGVRVGKHLIELEPHDAGRYVMLANLYANAGRWKEAMAVRREMEERGMKKEAGCSLIEWNGIVEEFVAGDWSHQQSKRIHEMIGEMERRLEMVGYVKDISQMLIDMDGEEEKGVAISYHSEKIAIAFAILNIGEAITIRIVKNLRVCKDCHNYTKLVSKVYQREIIVRDRNRFHHFKEGFCSCKDYW
ncbi:hypothetical protein KFK09_014411 [Dendrobium nobile]|uniref:DYW domain-containing protein n=1 Tax=Dendrobium nobile TaxID=94219 RepID=A0A8T3B1P4_DENNO|nr:hypothetical protein KFK09_014411 [Dendrobium nobile]